jgi:hypothetical protein
MVWSIIAGAIVVLILLFVSLFFPNLTERTKFFTTNALSALVLDVIIVQAYIYRKQWQAMREQRDAMKAQLGAMHDQARSLKDTLVETRNLISQNERTIKAAERSIQIAEKSMILAQRAWVTVTHGHIIQPATIDPTFELKITNSGNTPATQVQISARAQVRQNEPSDIDVIEISEASAEIGIIAPKEHVLRFVPTEQSISVDEKEWLQIMTARLYCWGIIRYVDIFDQERFTRFCFRQRTEPGTFGPCKTGNVAT